MTVSAHGATPDTVEPRPVGNSPEGRAGDFAVRLFVSPDPDGFLEQWSRPAQPGYVPQMTTTSKVKRGETIAAFIVFGGCAPDAAGNCDATADFEVLKPDKSGYGKFEGTELWRGKPAPAKGRLQLGMARLMMRIEPTDPLGAYTLNAVIHDRIANADISVTSRFDVTDEAAVRPVVRILPTAVQTTEDLNVFLRDYYKGRDPDLVAGAITVLGRERLPAHESSAAPVLAFFTYVFAANKTRIAEWTPLIDRQGEPTRTVLRNAIKVSAKPERLFAEKSPSPTLNDLRWGAFFATGDTAHVAALISLLNHMDERKDLKLYLAAASAKWSLASNARMHPLVRTSLVTAQSQVSTTKVRAEIEDVLSREPSEIQDAMTEVLKTQHAAGVW